MGSAFVLSMSQKNKKSEIFPKTYFLMSESKYTTQLKWRDFTNSIQDISLLVAAGNISIKNPVHQQSLEIFFHGCTSIASRYFYLISLLQLEPKLLIKY